MSRERLTAALERADAAKDLDEALLQEVAGALRDVFPNAPAHPESLGEPTEAVLHMIDRCLPGWTIRLKGRATEPDGHWNCSLRESDNLDNDAVIGTGRAPTVSLAMLEALLKIATMKARD